MDYERLDIERIRQKWDLRFSAYHAAGNAGEWSRLWEEFLADKDGQVDWFAAINIWGDNTMGYISSIANESYLNEDNEFWKNRARESLKGLQLNNIFHIDQFPDWHAQNIERYPLIKAYIEMVDHLRLQGINYIKMYVFKRYNIPFSLDE